MKAIIGSTILSQKDGVVILSSGYTAYLSSIKKLPAKKQLSLTTFLKSQGFRFFVDKRKNGYRLKVENRFATSKKFIKLFLKQHFFEEVCYEVKTLNSFCAKGTIERFVVTTLIRPSKILIA